MNKPTAWKDLLAEPTDKVHMVQLYQDDDFLAKAVSIYFGTGLDSREGLIAIATRDHTQAFKGSLRARGYDVDAVVQSGQLNFFDANETLGKSGYVNTSSFDYIRPENQPFAQLDRSKIKQMNLPDVEKRVKDGHLAFGSPKEVADRLIDTAERMGANRILLNLNLGALPYDLFLEQVRRFGRDVLPRLQAHQVERVPAG